MSYGEAYGMHNELQLVGHESELHLVEHITLDYVRKTLRALGISVQKNADAEYRVYFKGDERDSGYFATDLCDALDTGRAMASPVAGTSDVIEQPRAVVDAARAARAADADAPCCANDCKAYGSSCVKTTRYIPERLR